MRQPTRGYPAVIHEGSRNKEMLRPEDVRVLIDFPIYGGSLTTAIYVQDAFEQLGYQIKIVDNPICNDLFQEIKDVKNKNNQKILTSKLLNLLSNLYYHLLSFHALVINV